MSKTHNEQLKAAEKRRYTQQRTRPRLLLTRTGNMAKVLAFMVYGYITWRYVEFVLMAGHALYAPLVFVVSIIFAVVVDQLFNG